MSESVRLPEVQVPAFGLPLNADEAAWIAHVLAGLRSAGSMMDWWHSRGAHSDVVVAVVDLSATGQVVVAAAERAVCVAMSLCSGATIVCSGVVEGRYAWACAQRCFAEEA